MDVRQELEDLKVRLINSRKFSVQALISFEAELEELYDVQAGVELHGEASISTRSTRVTPISLAVRNKDIIRVKEELSFPPASPTSARFCGTAWSFGARMFGFRKGLWISEANFSSSFSMRQDGRKVPE